MHSSEIGLSFSSVDSTFLKAKAKAKSFYLTSVVPSATRLVSMEADGTPFTPLPLSLLRFTGI